MKNEMIAVLEIKNVPNGEAAYKAEAKSLLFIKSSSKAFYQFVYTSRKDIALPKQKTPRSRSVDGHKMDR
jgi:hypothetical protein